VAKDTIEIGATYSFTGPVAEVAKLQKRSNRNFSKGNQQSGGVEVGEKRMKIEALFGDDQTKPEIAINMFEHMVKSKQVTVVGGTAAHIPLALNIAAKKDKALLIATCATFDSYREQKVKAPNLIERRECLNSCENKIKKPEFLLKKVWLKRAAPRSQGAEWDYQNHSVFVQIPDCVQEELVPKLREILSCAHRVSPDIYGGQHPTSHGLIPDFLSN
jgi:hypothetical protein